VILHVYNRLFEVVKFRLWNVYQGSSDKHSKYHDRKLRKKIVKKVIKYSFLAIDTIKSISKCESGTRSSTRRATCDK